MRSIYSADAARGWMPWGLLAPVLCLAFIELPELPISFVLEGQGLTDAKGDPAGLWGLLAVLVFSFGAMGLTCLLWVMLVERRPLASIGLPAAQAGAFPLGHLTGALMICLVVAGIWFFGGYTAGEVGRAFRADGALLSIGLLLIAFALQASVEELLFRGWLLSAITRKLGLVAAIVLSGALFTLLHYQRGQDLLVTANVALFALFASCWAIRAGNIWGVMGWHAGWNWLLAVGFEVPVTGIDAHVPALIVAVEPHGPAHLTGGTQGPEGSVACAIVFVAAIAGMLVSRRRAAA